MVPLSSLKDCYGQSLDGTVVYFTDTDLNDRNRIYNKNDSCLRLVNVIYDPVFFSFSDHGLISDIKGDEVHVPDNAKSTPPHLLRYPLSNKPNRNNQRTC